MEVNGTRMLVMLIAGYSPVLVVALLFAVRDELFSAPGTVPPVSKRFPPILKFALAVPVVVVIYAAWSQIREWQLEVMGAQGWLTGSVDATAWCLAAVATLILLGPRLTEVKEVVRVVVQEVVREVEIIVERTVPRKRYQRSRSLPSKLRWQVLERDGHRCTYCGAHPSTDAELHIDHVVPVALGGTDDFDNLVTACRDCNLGKGAQPLAGHMEGVTP